MINPQQMIMRNKEQPDEVLAYLSSLYCLLYNDRLIREGECAMVIEELGNIIRDLIPAYAAKATEAFREKELKDSQLNQTKDLSKPEDLS